MSKYKYDLTVAATSEKEADEKMKAISVIASRLTATELAKLAYIIVNDPVKYALAKNALGV